MKNMELESAIGEDQVLRSKATRRDYKLMSEETDFIKLSTCATSLKWPYLRLRLELEDPRVLLL